VNGVHDMGGMHGFGPVEAEPEEPVFHAEWERRVFALNLAMGALGAWNIDAGRHSRERMPPADYLAATYYERWLWGLERLLEERGFVAPEELRRVTGGEAEVGGERRRLRPEALTADRVPAFLESRIAARVDAVVQPRFRPGDRVTARNLHPAGHTRLPRYVRGRRGVIDRDHGVFVFPDTHADGRGRKPQHVYSVRFAARELWGPDASSRDSVHVDLWDDYLDAA
jgi:nitrile hydratase beta subunit